MVRFAVNQLFQCMLRNSETFLLVLKALMNEISSVQIKQAERSTFLDFSVDKYPNKAMSVKSKNEKPKSKQSIKSAEDAKSDWLKKQKSKKRIIHEDMKVERWFLTRFSISDAYQGLCNEFDTLEHITNGWITSICTQNHSTFVQIPISTNASRTLKVNAQRIERQDGRLYLACEGPNLLTVYDFWTLVWHENVKTIISVNFPYEERLYPRVYQENQETIQYWPVVHGETFIFMPFKITCINSKLMADYGTEADADNDYIYRLTQLRIRYCNPIFPQQDRILSHVCYFRWPDGRLPLPWGKQTTLAEAADTLLQILLKIADDNVLVHCHAGLGRTGVLIALDFAIHQLKNSRTVNVEALIEKIRRQRPRAVMNRWQYAYINIVIAEQAYRMRLLDERTGGHITRHLINELWLSLEDDMNRNFGNGLSPVSKQLSG